jgi:hypothetical protein
MEVLMTNINAHGPTNDREWKMDDRRGKRPRTTADTTAQHHQLAYEPLLVGGNGGAEDE